MHPVPTGRRRGEVGNNTILGPIGKFFPQPRVSTTPIWHWAKSGRRHYKAFNGANVFMFGMCLCGMLCWNFQCYLGRVGTPWQETWIVSLWLDHIVNAMCKSARWAGKSMKTTCSRCPRSRHSQQKQSRLEPSRLEPSRCLRLPWKISTHCRSNCIAALASTHHCGVCQCVAVCCVWHLQWCTAKAGCLGSREQEDLSQTPVVLMEQCRGRSPFAESESAAHCLRPGPVPCCGKFRRWPLKFNAPVIWKFLQVHLERSVHRRGCVSTLFRVPICGTVASRASERAWLEDCWILGGTWQGFFLIAVMPLEWTIMTMANGPPGISAKLVLGHWKLPTNLQIHQTLCSTDPSESEWDWALLSTWEHEATIEKTWKNQVLDCSVDNWNGHILVMQWD